MKCPICQWAGREFLPFGIIPRKNAKCPNCGSLERHRLAYLYLKKIIFKDKNIKLLHFAPEACLADFFRSYKNIDYLSADLNPKLAMKKEDILSLSFPDNHFDIIVCIHILEHIKDDSKAMQELFRVLRPGGLAVIQVPVDYERVNTLEGLVPDSFEEKASIFNHPGHVRIYGRDYKDKLKKTGFEVEVFHCPNKKLVKRFSLQVPDEKLYVCSK